MARTKRLASAGHTYHVVNRGNDRRVIFPERADYMKFREFLIEGKDRFPVDVFGHCKMPNHIHMLLRPQTDDALSAYMQWVLCRYACYLRRKTDTVGYGHIFQRRFWSAPIVDDDHFRIVLRYIEGNPSRGKLVTNAEHWEWSSLMERQKQLRNLLSPLPLDLPDRWCALVNLGQTDNVLKRIREELKSTRYQRGK
jgi:putative transposase